MSTNTKTSDALTKRMQSRDTERYSGAEPRF